MAINAQPDSNTTIIPSLHAVPEINEGELTRVSNRNLFMGEK
jgi:hypothetical protein